jgi:hypothetical protein
MGCTGYCNKRMCQFFADTGFYIADKPEKFKKIILGTA